MNRRDFIEISFSAALALSVSGVPASSQAEISTFDSIVGLALKNNWNKLPIGELIGKVASALIGKPYIGGVLDEGDTEKCIVNLDKLDCVTFFELSIDFARLIKSGNLTYQNLIDEVTFTRYRSGKLTDYSSRLHYTSDWIYDNIRKSVVSDLTKDFGGKKINFNLSFMSSHPQYYSRLVNNPELIDEIKSYEKEINKRDYFIIDKSDISEIENKLMTGDIIAVATDKKGLDYSHTGLIYRQKGKSLFLHASSKQKKVVLDIEISDYLNKIKSDIGITILRPLEPANG